MVDLSKFKPKRPSDSDKIDKSTTLCDNCEHIKLLPVEDKLAHFLTLDDDKKLWYDESTLYHYADYVKQRINCWHDLNKGKRIKTIKQMLEVVIQVGFTERHLLHLRSFCIAEWKNYVTISN